MKVLIVGGGGREHAIAWKLRQSPKLTELFCAPGNAGIAGIAECVDIDAEDIDGITDFAVTQGIDLVVVGPEVPLAMGLVDRLNERGVKAFGPNKKCAQLEASKAFTKDFLERHNIPTAKYMEFYHKDELLDHVGLFGFPMVLKADGLAAGKGVIIAENAKEAREAIEDMMGRRIFGAAADTVVVEEYLTGIEASMLCFVDGSTIVPMEPAQDYKRIFDGDRGPNTGGMGTYSPSLIYNQELEDQIRAQILAPVHEGFKRDGLDFRGVLFIGLMITDKGPKVIEFNNRFGDPETQSILPRMESDLLGILSAVASDRLAGVEIHWRKEKSVCVVASSGGYPGIYEKGDVITGLELMDDDVLVFHAGTKLIDIQGDDGSGESMVVTSGGRVLGVTALGSTHEEAREKAYRNIERIRFKGMHYRKDIGSVNSTLSL
ncbi:phosphoribosylamine--glycine ligase [Clostridia bacterium]|nr:phosphoribosylamine--glycine ligase [Clostridia bacterium]